MFMESVLSDMNETLICINSDNTFKYEIGENNLRNLKSLAIIHDGILSYGLEILKWQQNIIPFTDDEKIFCDQLFGMIFNDNCRLGSLAQQSIFADNTYDFEKPFNVLK